MVKVSNIDQLLEWLSELVFRDYSSSSEVIQIIKHSDKELIAFLFTRRNQYVIHAHSSGRTDWNGYLSCKVITRKPRAGETWNRSRDLSDGDFSKDLWEKIKNDIISYELVPIVEKQQTESIEV